MKEYPYFKAQLTTAIVVLLLSVGYLRFAHTTITGPVTADLFALSVIGYIIAPVAIIGILAVKGYVYYMHERKQQSQAPTLAE